MRSLVFGLGLVAITLAGCGQAAPGNGSGALAGNNPPAGKCSQKTASGLGYEKLKAGQGPKVQPANSVVVNYKGVLASNGSEFDSGQAISFPVAGVVPGFAEGLQLMEKGATYRLCIPSKLGYGESGGGSIPPNADLVFEVDLLEIKDGEEAAADPAAALPILAAAERSCANKTASGLGYTVLTEGSGAKPTDSDIAIINYAGHLAKDGKGFDANKGMPMPLARVVPGFSEGLKLMGKGASYRLCIPAKLGYGSEDKGPIPANSDLVFRVDMLEFMSMEKFDAMLKAQLNGTGQ